MRIYVRLAPRASAQLEGDDGAWEYTGSGSDDANIYIADDLTVAQQRYELFHELQHAMTDLIYVGLRYHADLVTIPPSSLP